MKNILIVKMSSIGDVIHALPTLAVLRHHYPDAKISWIVEPKAYDIVRAHPYLDEVICLDLKNLTFQKIRQIKKQLRLAKYDLVLDLQGLLKSGLISYFTKAPTRLVYPISREGSGLLATKRVKARPESKHVIEKCLDTVRALHLSVSDTQKRDFQLTILPEDQQFAADFLAKNGLAKTDKLIGLNAGAAWPTKQWPTASFARLADLLIEKQDYRVLLFGGPGDLSLIENIQTQMQQKAISCAGKTTLKQLGALIQCCRVFVGSDTGPMHIAVAVQTPVVALFGPTDPNYSGPINPHDQVLWKQLPCAPCFKVHKCPQGTDLACMQAITPEEVYQAINRVHHTALE